MHAKRTGRLDFHSLDSCHGCGLPLVSSALPSQ